MREIQNNVFEQNSGLYTKNTVPGESVYGEDLLEMDGKEYRQWNPKRSKAAAAIKKGLDLSIDERNEILYLGAATGTTVSHLSDIVTEGFIIAVEYSQEVARDLVRLAEKRENIAPVISDARKPSDYSDLIDQADVVYQDISQKNQAEIFIKNSRRFLKDDGVGLIAVKAQSVSSTRDPEEVFEEVKNKLKEEFEIIEEEELSPYEKDHLFLKLKKN